LRAPELNEEQNVSTGAVLRQDNRLMSDTTTKPAAEHSPRPPTGRARLEPPDLSERGGQKDGQPQRSDERLFMQLTAYGDCRDVSAAIAQLTAAKIDAVLYEDLNDARGVALLVMHRDPNFFVDILRPLLNTGALAGFSRKPELTMFGRTYSLGYEPDLRDVLLARPRRTVLNPVWRWAVWYPLRRNGAFAQLPPEQQRVILAEHGEIGMRYGAADYVHDVRLACHGLDRDDNDFVIGLLGKDLYPLSAIIQAMRKTQQTSMYLDRLGPFFVGRAVWQAPDRGDGA
jgi:Chlorite dismutase